MSLTARTFTMVALVIALSAPLLAQEAATETTATAASTTTTSTQAAAEAADATAKEAASAEPAEETTRSAHNTRHQFTSLLRQHPPELGTILALDPTLLSNDAFLAGYTELAEFVKAHPEVRRNPDFYLEGFGLAPPYRSTFAERVVEGVMIFSVFALVAFALSWLVRTTIEQKRWNRLTRTQTEVHTKLLDRFGSSEELLQYIRTPAGAKFLESAPIPLYADKPATNAPVSRIIWSIQLGVILAAAAIGMLLVSLRFDSEAARELFAMGIIGLCIGGGFAVSALISMSLSKRLGVWQERDASSIKPLDDSGLVR